MTPNIAPHESVLDKQLTLVLNRSWLPIGHLSVKKAVVALMGGDKDHPVMALDMAFDEEGAPTYTNPVPWETWVALPVRDCDLYVQTHKGRIRVPTVVITRTFNKVPVLKPRVSSRTIFERDNGRCQYTGKSLTRSGASLDHIIPRSRGGRDSFSNLVLCDKEVNLFKADRTPEEAGLRLIRKPVTPPDMPVSATIREAHHRDWIPFLMR